MDSRNKCSDKRADTMNQNLRSNNDNSDEETLVTISRRISDNGNVSDNGNLEEEEVDVLRIRRTSENRTDVDSTEECPNDSFTDEEGDVNYYNHLRRRRYVNS